MIGWLQGVLIEKEQPGKLVLNANGVGYDVETSFQTFMQIEQQTSPIALHIHTVVREDAFLLYGFHDKTERALFRSLIKVSGIGPKLAIAILSAATPADLIRLIRQKDKAALVQIPGIGQKTADRLLIEMKEAVETFEIGLPTNQSSTIAQQGAVQEAVAALISLGYTAQEAKKAVSHCDDSHQPSAALIRQALQVLGRG